MPSLGFTMRMIEWNLTNVAKKHGMCIKCARAEECLRIQSPDLREALLAVIREHIRDEHHGAAIEALDAIIEASENEPPRKKAKRRKPDKP